MKPKPFSALNHFTVPCATCAPTFRATDDPSRSEGRVSALPPVGHERGTRTARKGTTRKPEIQVIHAESIPGRAPAPSRAPPGACEGWGGRGPYAMSPDARADFSDGSTRCVGPTTGSSG